MSYLVSDSLAHCELTLLILTESPTPNSSPDLNPNTVALTGGRTLTLTLTPTLTLTLSNEQATGGRASFHSAASLQAE